MKHDNTQQPDSRRDIYNVPDGFFDAEKKRLSQLARGPWQIQRRIRRRNILWTTSLTAAAAIACLIVIRGNSSETIQNGNDALAPATQNIAQASGNSTDSHIYLDMPQEMIDNDLFMNTYQ